MVDEAVNDKPTLLVQEDLGMINLFRVTTIVKQYSGHRNVKFEWFVEERKEPPVPYAKAIRDYDPHDDRARYAEFAVNELLTRDEAEALKVYLDKYHGNEGVTAIKQYSELQIRMNTMGLSCIPTGGGPDNYMLWKEPRYSLPFQSAGYFDLRDAERIDGCQNVAHLSGRLLVGNNEGKTVIISVRDEIERLFAEHKDWTTDQALAELCSKYKTTLKRADGRVIG
jgi:hypothetical protein